MRMLNEANGSIAGAGALLKILRDGQARTRAELVQLTGLARSTLAQRLEALLSQQWIIPTEEAISSGGRPAIAFTFNRCRPRRPRRRPRRHPRPVVITDLGTEVLAERAAEISIDRGPEETLGLAPAHLRGDARRDRARPGRGLRHRRRTARARSSTARDGRSIPPIMPGWDGFPVPSGSARLGDPVLVDNDVNIMALGEHWAAGREADHLIFVKIGTGIGCGIISGRRLHRGARARPATSATSGWPRPSTPSAAAATSAAWRPSRAAPPWPPASCAAGVEASDSRDVVRLVAAATPRRSS